MSISAFSEPQMARDTTGPRRAVADLDLRLHQRTGGKEGESTPAENCLLPLLRALKWDGLERHLFEALPHLEPVASIYGLRAILARLNYATTPSRKSPGALTPEYFPCLFETEDDILVLLGKTEAGDLLAYSGRSKAEQCLPSGGKLRGTLYLMSDNAQTFKSQAQFKHWSSRLAHQFRGTLAKLFLIGLLSNFLALALPIFTMTIYDKAMGAKSMSVLVTLLIGILLIFALDALTKHTKSRLQAYFGTRLDNVITNSTFRHFLHMPLPVTSNAPIGAQITRLRQFDGVREIFHSNLANALINLPFSAIFIVALAIIGGTLSLLPAGLLFGYVLAGYFLVPRMKRAIAVTGEAKSRLQNITVESLTKNRAIRSLSANDVWLEKYRTIYSDFAQKNLRTRHLSAIIQILSQTMMTSCGVAVLAFGAIRVLDGQMTAGALIAVMALSWRSLNPMHQAFLSLTQLGQVQQTIERIDGLFRVPLEREPGALPSLQRSLQGTLRVSGLLLRYPTRQEPALKNLSLEIPKGEVLAITGPSGSGKSSLLKAILGLYPTQMGAILVDNLDIRQLDPGEWRYCIGYAPDEFDFFYGTVAQNLRMADPQADDAQVLEVFKDFGLHNYPDFLPEGLETRLTGTLMQAMPDNLKQLMLLARTFLRPAPIYLLDNPGCSLDQAGDKLLVEKIEKMRGTATVIMTTYRPSHMRLADKVAYLQNGQLTIYGPPDEVLDDIMSR